MRCSWFALPFLSGCFGVYAEVAATTLPSATIEGSTSTGATSIGFNVGGDFSSARMRFSTGYASDSTSFDGGSAKLGTGSSRFDFNVFSVSDRARVRLGLGFAKGSGSSQLGTATEKHSDGGGVFGGIDVTYFVSWKLAAHLFGGPTYFSQTIPGGTVSGTGATFRLALSYSFGDIRPDSHMFIPLEGNRDLTGLLETGAESVGCDARRDSNPSSGYALLRVKCKGREVLYMQVAEGIGAICMSMFKGECETFTARLMDATAATLKATPEDKASPASVPAATPAPSTPAESPAGT